MSKFELIIEPGRANKNYWVDLIKYRELFAFLAWRDILIRYKQTVIGLAWAVIRPLLTMIVFTVIFGKLAKLPSGGAPYAILVFSAMLPWQFFSNSLSECSLSLIANSNLLTKIYFPRLIMPAGSVIVSFVDFIIAFILLIFLMIFYGFVPSLNILLLPIFIGLAFIVAFGAGIIFAALNVKYRDFRYVVPFIVQFGLYLSPVGFSSSVVPAKWRLLYSLNPMVGVIDGFRWAIMGGTNTLYLPGLLLSISIAILLLLYGIWYFRKMESEFADIV
jgi:lipopolysaccharide transport system permease protein